MPEIGEGHDPAALHRLCARLGIATDYHDIWGHRHRVAQQDLAALLQAFGIDCAADLHAIDEAMDRQAWSQALPPVVAVSAGQGDWTVLLRLPAGWERVHWRLEEEGGAIHEGQVDVEAMTEAARGQACDGARTQRRLHLALRLPPGYHRLSVGDLPGHTRVVCAPARGWEPPALQGGGRVWGPSVQLYALRSQRNWGMGDFTDLAALVAQSAARGAGIVGLNPLHALFAHNPAHISPYSPSSRRHLNVLYIDVEQVTGWADCEPARRRVRSSDFQERLALLRQAAMVDYPGVAAAKFEILELLWTEFRERHLQADGAPASREGEAFAAFVRAAGEPLRHHGLFEALQASFHAADPQTWGWPVWPQAYRDPASAQVAAFEREHPDRVGFHQFLQWQARLQLARVARDARALGMGVGLYLDLAVSVDRAGSDAWSAQDVFALEAGVGAPPDDFNASGQAWGLPPLRPDRLRQRGHDVFIEVLRANMRGVGALRIDHVMALMRLFWIPPGLTPREGAYVHYPLDELLAIVALESERNQCMVIGEDLGTVADEVREALSRSGVLSYRLLYFERDGQGGFKAPAQYPRQALVAASTHDLPTLAGWWRSHDLQLRQSLALFPDPTLLARQLLERAQDRIRLLLAVQREGLLDAKDVAAAAGCAVPPPSVVSAVHAWLARAPSAVMMVQLEDVLGMPEQANLPGTTDQHPNWRRKLALGLKALETDERWNLLAQALRAERPQSATAHEPVQARIPRATYRLQLNKDFGFDDAIRVLPYLERLGVSHVYCSPVQRSRAGSTHGYDVVAHHEVNPELGGEAGLRRLVAALRGRDMGLLLDMVPNHMGVWGDDNAWWLDVLENGPASVYAQHFDIDWQPLDPELAGKVLMPLLGGPYGEVLARGELVLRFDEAGGAFAVQYFEHRLPLAPETYVQLLGPARARLADPDLADRLASLATAFGHLPQRQGATAAQCAERDRDKELLKSRLARLVAREPAVAEAIAAVIASFNAQGPRDALDALMAAQAWRPAFWRVASDEVNYRRFFDIGGLAAIRIERDEVFEATHGFALDLAARGDVDGLRIDHPDGLYDPAGYFRKLQEGYARRLGMALPAHDNQGRPVRPLYVVAEKIAAGHEDIPEAWHVHGTTGYRFANVVNAVMVDTTAERSMLHTWRRFTGEQRGFAEVARRSRIAIMRSALASELHGLSTQLLRIARGDRRTRDYTLNGLRRALTEVTACLPVYRTYLLEGSASPQDRHFVQWAVRDALTHSEEDDLSVFDFIQRCLLGEVLPDAPAALAAQVRRFAARFQQFSSPVAAKGVEDTAFYRWFALASLNEVGGEPAQFGMTVAQFHAASADRGLRWPHTMLATSTHDHKRSEDVRNRIDVLSEMPGAWRLASRRWRAMNQALRERLVARGAPPDAPSALHEYLLYQTLLGTWPGAHSADALYAGRLAAYMRKAARESKLRTRWTQPDEAYEAALEAFVRGLLDPAQSAPFLSEVSELGQRLAGWGALNSVSTTLLKHASPGVPDTYQGHEAMALTLVDPDNRQPVDYAGLARELDALEALGSAAGATLGAAPADGRAKLWVARQLLDLRRREPQLLQLGHYQPLACAGPQHEHLIAFARQWQGRLLVAITGRLWSQLPVATGQAPLGVAAWADTRVETGLPEGTRLLNLLDGQVVQVRQGCIAVAEAFARFPGAALVPADG